MILHISRLGLALSSLFILLLAGLPESTNGVEFQYYFNAECEPYTQSPGSCVFEFASPVTWDGTVNTDDLTDCSCDCATLEPNNVTTIGTCYGSNCFILCDRNGETELLYLYYTETPFIEINTYVTPSGGCRTGQSPGDGCVWITSDIDNDGGDTASCLHTFW